jgi:carbamate kinase
MLVVAALGQSALASPDVLALEERVRTIARSLAPIARVHQLVVTHSAGTRVLPLPSGLPADLQAAQTAGLVGHLLARELRNALPRTPVTSLLAEAAVHCDRDDIADGLVSPAVGDVAPCRIVELSVLNQLAERDDLVLCVGCVPVQLDRNSLLAHSDAHLDHDQVAATLGIELRADILLLLTDVAAVYTQWPAADARIASFPAQQPVPDQLDAGTIGNKMQAACRVAHMPGTFAVIGAADDAEALVAGRAGTCIALTS